MISAKKILKGRYLSNGPEHVNEDVVLVSSPESKEDRENVLLKRTKGSIDLTAYVEEDDEEEEKIMSSHSLQLKINDFEEDSNLSAHSPSTPVIKRVDFSPVNQVKYYSPKDSVKLRVSNPRKDSRSILSPKLDKVANLQEKQLSKFNKVQLEQKQRMHSMQQGSFLRKYASGGRFEVRLFWVTADGSELRWAKPVTSKYSKSVYDYDTSKITSYKKVDLGEVVFMVFGPRTRKFNGYDWLKDHPENCFSIVMPTGDTVDIECESREQFMTWYMGIRSLTPLTHKTYNRSQVNWHRALYKTLQFSKVNNVEISQVWNELVDMSRKDAKKDEKQKYSDVQMMLKLYFGEELELASSSPSLDSSSRKSMKHQSPKAKPADEEDESVLKTSPTWVKNILVQY